MSAILEPQFTHRVGPHFVATVPWSTPIKELIVPGTIPLQAEPRYTPAHARDVDYIPGQHDPGSIEPWAEGS